MLPSHLFSLLSALWATGPDDLLNLFSVLIERVKQKAIEILKININDIKKIPVCIKQANK